MIPNILWHYTDAAGLFGIVRDNGLRFGDARFMNDRTERTYASDVFESCFQEAIEREGQETAHELRGLLRKIYGPDVLYAVSFSETPESLSQWQRYGANGAGYCLGFEGQGLNTFFADRYVVASPMLYQIEEQKAEMRKAILAALTDYRRMKAMPSPTHLDYMFLGWEIQLALLRMKHPFFSDEREWRYKYQVSEDGMHRKMLKEEWAVRGSVIKPFLKMDGTSMLPLKKVVCGPRLEPELALQSVKAFLKNHGHDGCEVTASELGAVWR